mmetsp:Transcript_11121/g.51544  ORF Transcript_11121/g.51544 Transcript_11121/m.51544 type:complete len:212 (-) Transcript_11121:3420-4055(-)
MYVAAASAADRAACSSAPRRAFSADATALDAVDTASLLFLSRSDREYSRSAILASRSDTADAASLKASRACVAINSYRRSASASSCRMASSLSRAAPAASTAHWFAAFSASLTWSMALAAARRVPSTTDSALRRRSAASLARVALDLALALAPSSSDRTFWSSPSRILSASWNSRAAASASSASIALRRMRSISSSAAWIRARPFTAASSA